MKRKSVGLSLMYMIATGILLAAGGFGCSENKVEATGEALAQNDNTADCSFIKACDPGTHPDYKLCQCVKDLPCPDISCANPPPGCTWNRVVENGCTTACGILTCTPTDPKLCQPPPSCPAPPFGCQYQLAYDKNGCVIGCGTLVCRDSDPARDGGPGIQTPLPD